MLKALLTEQLTVPVLSRYTGLIDSADHCWALKVLNGSAAIQVLDCARWRIGSNPLVCSAEAKLARWTHRVMMGQMPDGRALSSIEQAILAYGVEMRLWYTAMAKTFLEQSVIETGKRMADLAIDVVADDPYLRDAFTHAGGMRAEVGSVRVHRIPGALPLLGRVREQLAANWWLRSTALRLYQESARWRSQPYGRMRAAGRRKTAAFFVLNQRYMDLFQPVLSELESRGWWVPVLCYNPLTRPPVDAVAFADAAVGGQALTQEDLRRPHWVISDALLRESPVSRTWVAVALSASWAAAKTQMHRHRRVLEFLRPDTVISFGPETMSLAIQGAAKSLGIPSLLMAHGFQGPVQSSLFFSATASAVIGPACREANRIDQYGNKREGLVATGQPPYDDMLLRSVNSGGERKNLPHLSLPVERPYLVLFFVWWGPYLFGHALQRKNLKMLAEALPKDAFLVCKLHPVREEREICEAVLGACLPKGAFRVVGESEYSTPDLLESCHVAVMQPASMSLNDAIVMGRPAIVIQHEEDTRSVPDALNHISLNHPSYSCNDACWRVSSVDELREALFALTRDEYARQRVLKHRGAYIKRFLVASDGQSTQRVADLVEYLGRGKDPDSFIPAIGDSLVPES